MIDISSETRMRRRIAESKVRQALQPDVDDLQRQIDELKRLICLSNLVVGRWATPEQENEFAVLRLRITGTVL